MKPIGVQYTPEALADLAEKMQGQSVPLTDGLGGPVIGEVSGLAFDGKQLTGTINGLPLVFKAAGPRARRRWN